MFIYHITPQADWKTALAAGSYSADSLASEGFIHCSEAGQVIPVANQLYRHRQDLVLLEIEKGRAAAPIRYENLEGGAEMYPHIYGALNLDAVRRVYRFQPAPGGSFTLPEGMI